MNTASTDVNMVIQERDALKAELCEVKLDRETEKNINSIDVDMVMQERNALKAEVCEIKLDRETEQNINSIDVDMIMQERDALKYNLLITTDRLSTCQTQLEKIELELKAFKCFPTIARGSIFPYI